MCVALRRAEFLGDHLVDQILHPGEHRREAYFFGDLLLRLSAVARFICWVSACGEIEKAKQTMRASHSSNGPFGSLVWMKVFGDAARHEFGAPARDLVCAPRSL
jgi:hypothetical protein